MPGFSRVSSFATAEEQGRSSFCSFRKVPGQASAAGNWVDLSMAAGNPRPNYYATEPLVGAKLDPLNGVFHGADKAPASKHLSHWGLMTPTAGLVGAYRLLDFLLYYPFVDGDDTDVQTFDNTQTLDRYADGDDVKVMAVCVAPTTGGGSFVVSYTDHAGSPQVSPTIALNTTAANIATIATSEQAQSSGGQPFLPLNSRGVRSIESVQMIAPSGGLLAFVLVRPIASGVIREINTMHETEFVRTSPGAPRVYDGAYLGMIANCAASVAAGQLAGYARFYWSE